MSNLTQILNKLEKPGRYIGGETNSVCKDFSADKLSVVLAYPDIYEIGMSYLGLRILYHLLNERDDIICERVFMPWKDMAQELAGHDKKLFSLESKRDINKFDVVGFSLSYELTYTNVLSMLDMGGIEIFSNKRSQDSPLVIAGGACAYNPEPMSPFFDAFIIGDGEESLPFFLDKYRDMKNRLTTRKEILKKLSGIKGVYVPSLYEAKYVGANFAGLVPLDEDAPKEIEKTTVEDFENAYYPVKQIVPLIKTVHDRLVVEIMRGCPNRCRFCHASVTSSPVRIRSLKRVRDICHQTYKYTGYETIALLSLSSINYPYLTELVKTLVGDFHDRAVSISIPSLRVEEAFYDLPAMIASISKTGLTFAMESANSLIRDALGKSIDFQVLCKSAETAFSHGWRRLKLYFMAGFPGESENEADNIIDLARKLSFLKKEVSSSSAEISLSVNPFIPKAHTPLQWLGMQDKDKLALMEWKLLAGASRKIKVEFHNIKQSVLEACLSRGDRRMADIIYAAWEKGAGMDSWTEFFNFGIWQEAFNSFGIDIYDLSTKRYKPQETLPWAHIKTNVSDEYLGKELEKSGLYS